MRAKQSLQSVAQKRPIQREICTVVCAHPTRGIHWIADAHRGDGKRFIVRADEKLTAFLELQQAIHDFAVSLML